MIIAKPTYLIAELSGEVVPLVNRFRAEYNPERVAWPVDITIAGSSGVGVLDEGEDVEDVIRKLSPVVEKNFFSEVHFLEIGNFPGTGSYFLFPERCVFDNFHKDVIESGVKFKNSPFPYTPHCTLKEGRPMASDKVFEALEFPEISRIECFSLYQPWANGGNRLHRFELAPGGDAPR